MKFIDLFALLAELEVLKYLSSFPYWPVGEISMTREIKFKRITSYWNPRIPELGRNILQKRGNTFVSRCSWVLWNCRYFVV